MHVLPNLACLRLVSTACTFLPALLVVVVLGLDQSAQGKLFDFSVFPKRADPIIICAFYESLCVSGSSIPPSPHQKEDQDTHSHTTELRVVRMRRDER